MEFDNSLRRQSFDLPNLFEEQFEDLLKQTETLAGEMDVNQVQHILLTGCGDSYAAGMAMRYAVEELTKLPTELVNVIDFVNFYPKNRLSKHVLLIPISISGDGVRIKQAVLKGNQHNAVTLGITKNSSSDVGDNVKHRIDLHISPFERGPGNRNYFVSLLALLFLALQIGHKKGFICVREKRKFLDGIKKQMYDLNNLLPEMDQVLLEAAYRWREKTAFDFIGAGPDYASAWFGHAKIIEALGAFATHINSEEWFHMNNFFKDRTNCGTVFVATKNNGAFERTAEAVNYALRINRPTLVITDSTECRFNSCAVTVTVPDAEFEYACVLTSYVPTCILAGYLGAMAGEKNCRGCLGAWEFAAGGAFIKN